MDIEELINPSPEKNVHFHWHRFCESWYDEDGRPKYSGYEAMKFIERYALDHPEAGIVKATVDDSSFCGSGLYFFPHKCEEDYMGVTTIYVPQCTGEPPTKFFLYPSHIEELIPILRGLYYDAIKSGVFDEELDDF